MTYCERLQLREPRPAEEICSCSARTPLHLRYAFSEFPLFCIDCAGQILPSALSLTESLAQELVRWRTIYAALYDLWLDSSEYEAFGREALLNLHGDVNRCGLSLASQLSEQRKTYYWLFSDDPDKTWACCPLCDGSMTGHRMRRFVFCDHCRISIGQ